MEEHFKSGKLLFFGTAGKDTDIVFHSLNPKPFECERGEGECEEQCRVCGFNEMTFGRNVIVQHKIYDNGFSSMEVKFRPWASSVDLGNFKKRDLNNVGKSLCGICFEENPCTCGKDS